MNKPTPQSERLAGPGMTTGAKLHFLGQKPPGRFTPCANGGHGWQQKKARNRKGKR